MKTKRGEEAAEEMSKANRGCFTMFKERNHIPNIKIQGEVTSVDVEPAPSDLEDLAKTINEVLVLRCSVGSNSFAAPWTVLPGSFVHGISQARILGSIAISSSKGSS